MYSSKADPSLVQPYGLPGAPFLGGYLYKDIQMSEAFCLMALAQVRCTASFVVLESITHSILRLGEKDLSLLALRQPTHGET